MILLLVLAAVLFPFSVQAIETHLLIGQSNMSGMADTSMLTEAQAEVPKNIELWVNGDRLKSFTDLPTYGPELVYVKELAKAKPDKKFIIIKYAVGSTSLLSWKPQWTCEEADLINDCDKGPLYQMALDAVRDVIKGRKAKVKAIVMMQGERDSACYPAAKIYGKNLKSLIDSFRRDLNPELVFILGVTNTQRNHTHLVAQDQMDVVRLRAGVYPVSMEGLTKMADQVHFDEPGQFGAGKRFAERYLKTVK